MLSEMKTTLPRRNKDWKTFKLETGKINVLLTHIPTNNINELNELTLWKNRGSPSQHKLRFKIWIGNRTGNSALKASTTGKNTKTE